MTLLQIDHLRVQFTNRLGTFTPLNDVSLTLHAGEILGIVGESGAGKSLTGLSVMGLLDPPLKMTGGKIFFKQKRIDQYSENEFRTIRGKSIGAIFQDPLTSLNPLFTVGEQLVETIQTHFPLEYKIAREKALNLLKDVGIPAPQERLDQYPHQFSGGMRQRVVIALALASEPDLILADEPTTALDVCVQAQIISLLKDICRSRKTAVMLITHDMGVIAQICDRVAVMYAGRVVEIAKVDTILNSPKHPYTQALIASIPDLQAPSGEKYRLTQIKGNMPRLNELIQGCPFKPRCDYATNQCTHLPMATYFEDHHEVHCWLTSSK